MKKRKNVHWRTRQAYTRSWTGTEREKGASISTYFFASDNSEWSLDKANKHVGLAYTSRRQLYVQFNSTFRDALSHCACVMIFNS